MGAGAASAISLAMARDRLESSTREKVLSQISVIMALAPMISPSIGSLIMKYLSWPWLFVAQGILGGVALVGVIATSESYDGEPSESILKLMQKYVQVFRNKRFMGIVFCNAMIALPLFAFIVDPPVFIFADSDLASSSLLFFLVLMLFALWQVL